MAYMKEHLYHPLKPKPNTEQSPILLNSMTQSEVRKLHNVSLKEAVI